MGLNQKALLIIDNATVHLCNFELCDENIKVIFLPPNTTALIQPLDQGVISCFKRVYKREFLREYLISKDRNTNNNSVINYAKEFTLYDSIQLADSVWNSISISVLKNSWNKLGINTLVSECSSIEAIKNPQGTELIEVESILNDHLGVDSRDLEELEKLDIGKNGYEHLTEEMIIMEALTESCKCEQVSYQYENVDKQNSDSENKDETDENPINHAHGYKIFADAIKYADGSGNYNQEFINLLKIAKDIAEASKMKELKQGSIFSYLNSKNNS